MKGTWPLLILCAVLLPFVSHAAEPKAVAHFALANDERTASRPGVISFGQVFRDGDVRIGQSLSLRLDGTPAPVQIDPKAFYDDGSIRHAIVSIEAPALEAHSKLAGEVATGAGGTKIIGATSAAGAFDVPPLVVTIAVKSGAAPGKTVIDLRAVARDGAKRVGGSWIAGPLAEERRYAASVNDKLEVIFDVRVPRTGPSQIDVGFHNDWAGTHHADTIEYSVAILLAGANVYQASSVRHYPFATWHHVVSTDAVPPPRVIPNLADLIAAGAVPRYATTVKIGTDLATELSDLLRAAKTAPLNSGTVTQHMPETGGRMDIGPLPAWAAAYLLSGSVLTEKVLLADGDAAGSIPWHLRAKATRAPLTIDQYPDLWLDPRGTPAPGIVPEPFENEMEGWTIDNAHQPSLVYLPYLLTGSQYYRDELAAQAAYLLLSYDPGYRGGSHGYIIGEHGEAWTPAREIAWTLRTLGNAAYALPKSDPMQAYVEAKLKGNLAQLVQLFIAEHRQASAGELEGWFPGPYRPDGATAPWQQAFIAITLGWLSDMGYADAARLAAWMNNFLSGLFTSTARGYDPERGVAYILNVYDPATNRNFNTWHEAFEKSDFSSVTPDELAEQWQDYGAVMRAALGTMLTLTRSASSAKAYGFVVARTMNLKWDYAKDPTFSLVPRFSDGSSLLLSDIRNATSEPLEGNERANILYGRAGDDTISGGAGDDLIFGRGGNDTLDGGPGNDFLFGDKGDDTIILGLGDDVAEGGPGHDRFVFKSPGRFAVRITDFNTGEDRLVFARAFGQPSTGASPAGVTVHLPGGGEIILEGVRDAAAVLRATDYAD